MSWKPEVFIDIWRSTRLRFATRQEAETYVFSLSLTTRGTRVTLSNDPVTHRYDAGKLTQHETQKNDKSFRHSRLLARFNRGAGANSAASPIRPPLPWKSRYQYGNVPGCVVRAMSEWSSDAEFGWMRPPISRSLPDHHRARQHDQSGKRIKGTLTAPRDGTL